MHKKTLNFSLFFGLFFLFLSLFCASDCHSFDIGQAFPNAHIPANARARINNQINDILSGQKLPSPDLSSKFLRSKQYPSITYLPGQFNSLRVNPNNIAPGRPYMCSFLVTNIGNQAWDIVFPVGVMWSKSLEEMGSNTMPPAGSLFLLWPTGQNSFYTLDPFSENDWMILLNNIYYGYALFMKTVNVGGIYNYNGNSTGPSNLFYGTYRIGWVIFFENMSTYSIGWAVSPVINLESKSSEAGRFVKDLSIEEITTDPEIPRCGSCPTVHIIVANKGNVGMFNVPVKLSNGIVEFTKNTGYIPANSSYDLCFDNFYLDEYDSYLSALIEIFDSNQKNNSKVARIRLRPPVPVFNTTESWVDYCGYIALRVNRYDLDSNRSEDDKVTLVIEGTSGKICRDNKILKDAIYYERIVSTMMKDWHKKQNIINIYASVGKIKATAIKLYPVIEAGLALPVKAFATICMGGSNLVVEGVEYFTEKAVMTALKRLIKNPQNECLKLSHDRLSLCCDKIRECIDISNQNFSYDVNFKNNVANSPINVKQFVDNVEFMDRNLGPSLNLYGNCTKSIDEIWADALLDSIGGKFLELATNIKGVGKVVLAKDIYILAAEAKKQLDKYPPYKKYLIETEQGAAKVEKYKESIDEDVSKSLQYNLELAKEGISIRGKLKLVEKDGWTKLYDIGGHIW